MIYIIGSGLFGSVLAERISCVLNKKVTVIEKRNHIGGNCYSFIDKETGINCHKYGAHIFHTSDTEVFHYISQFTKFNNYKHQVWARANKTLFSMPINLSTINKFFNKEFTPIECENFLKDLIGKDKINEPKNLEEQAISLIGKDLYKAFIYGYTKKQWQRDPKELPAYIIKRLPFRTNYCADYFSDIYQGIPLGGYTPLFENLLSNENITVNLNTSFNDIRKEIKSDDLIIYTGPIDELFNYCYGELEWRSLDFKWHTLNEKDHQGCAVLNESEESIPYTRTHEFKHFHPEAIDAFNCNKTIICHEYSKEYKKGDIQYYPIDTEYNRSLYQKYFNKSKEFENLIVGGRLGSYQYMDMDKVIKRALETFKIIQQKY